MMAKPIYVVPSLKAKGQALVEAKEWADSIGAVYVKRQKRTTAALRRDYGNQFLVYAAQGPKLFRPDGSHVFSLNMAQLRIDHLRKGQTDHFLDAIDVTRTTSLLDCTCGFGADSIVASFALPKEAIVTALEVSPLMAAVTGWGFSHFVHEEADVTAALRRITLHCCDYRDFLQSLPDRAYDVIYLDPMFAKPILASCQFQPVRDILEHHQLTHEDIVLALRKARHRVVVKGRYFQKLQAEFPTLRLYGGKYSRVHYAVWEVEENG